MKSYNWISSSTSITYIVFENNWLQNNWKPNKQRTEIYGVTELNVLTWNKYQKIHMTVYLHKLHHLRSTFKKCTSLQELNLHSQEYYCHLDAYLGPCQKLRWIFLQKKLTARNKIPSYMFNMVLNTGIWGKIFENEPSKILEYSF